MAGERCGLSGVAGEPSRIDALDLQRSGGGIREQALDALECRVRELEQPPPALAVGSAVRVGDSDEGGDGAAHLVGEHGQAARIGSLTHEARSVIRATAQPAASASS